MSKSNGGKKMALMFFYGLGLWVVKNQKLHLRVGFFIKCVFITIAPHAHFHGLPTRIVFFCFSDGFRLQYQIRTSSEKKY